MLIRDIKSKLRELDSDKYVYFDFCALSPTTIDSWRGSYNLPAIGWAQKPPSTVKELLEELNTATSGRIYYGYKGGEYTFNEDQDLYVDNYGIFSETMITDVLDKGWCVILCTQRIDY